MRDLSVEHEPSPLQRRKQERAIAITTVNNRHAGHVGSGRRRGPGEGLHASSR